MLTSTLHRLPQYLFPICMHIALIFTLSGGITASKSSTEYLVGRKQFAHNPSQLPDSELIEYSNLSEREHLYDAIKSIAIPRVVGTVNHTIVRQYIVQSLRDLDWNVELDSFHDTVPILDELHFHNIIATPNPNAKRYLVLACHYDSKYIPGVTFVGATDSAVPCAMLLNLAKVLQKPLEKLKTSELSLMFIFFDGEEAFKEWGPTDSIYGARHLAKRWEKEQKLDRIDLLVLLDLIGAPDPAFFSWFDKTAPWHMRLANLETRLSEKFQFERYSSSGMSQREPGRYFQRKTLRGSGVQDDHLPFLERNIPILHLIPLPFPSVWHTVDDNESVIDYATTNNLALIIRLFTIEYLLAGGK